MTQENNSPQFEATLGPGPDAGRAVCPWCRRRVRVTADMVIFRHMIPGKQLGVRGYDPCPGSKEHISATPQPLLATDTLLARLRAVGWMVAVHNDYRINGDRRTFWLFTHPDGCWLKGEGRSYLAALSIVYEAAGLAATTGQQSSQAPETTATSPGRSTLTCLAEKQRVAVSTMRQLAEKYQRLGLPGDRDQCTDAADVILELAGEVERRTLAWDFIGKAIGNPELVMPGPDGPANHIAYLRDLFRALSLDILGEGSP